MKTIRTSVFETNSSSMHAISFATDEPKVTVDKLYISASGEYGWEIHDYEAPDEKLDYATVAFMLIARNEVKSELENDVTDYIEEKLKNVAECFAKHGVTVEFAEDLYKVDIKRYGTNVYTEVEISGYIDHQSAPYEDSDSAQVARWFAEDPEELFKFVFNSSFVHTDNDNH
jgi:hypothetical protein